jgi:putative transposase
MPNHWHLVLRPHADGTLSDFVRWLTVTHTQRYHAAHRTGGTGPLYQGRFKSFPVQDDGHLLSLIRYVERNPVRANLVERADDWRWGSASNRAALAPLGPPLLPMDRWPAEHGWTPTTWPRHVDEPHTAAELAALRTTLARGRPLGESPWRERVANRHGLDASLRPLGRPRKNPDAHQRPRNGT